jgi:hypothetical protein
LSEECYFNFSCSLLCDEQGVERGVLNVVFETTERIRKERELVLSRVLEAQALLDAKLARQEIADFVNQAPSPMVVLLGPDHRFSLANPAYGPE